MKKFLMFFTGIVAVAAMMLSCNPSDSTEETPQEGKHNTNMVGTFSLDRARIVVETSVDSLRYENITLYSYKDILDSITMINKYIASGLSDIDITLNLKETGLFSVTLSEDYDGTIYTDVFPDDLEAEREFPYMREDFTWFSTSTSLYLAVNRPKTDVLINTLLADLTKEPVEDPIPYSPSKIKTQVNKVAAALAAAVEGKTYTVKDIEKYLAALLYVSEDVYAYKVKYVLLNDVLVLIPADKEFITTALATADLVMQEYFKILEAEERISTKATWETIKGIAQQVLKDCSKIQIEITLAKEK